MNENLKYSSKLYHPEKPYYKMSIEELYEHSKICKSLDRTSYAKMSRMEKWDVEKLQKKKNKFLNKNKIRKTKKRAIIISKTKKNKFNRNQSKNNRNQSKNNRKQNNRKQRHQTKKLDMI